MTGAAMSPDEAAAVLRRAAEIQAERELGADDVLDAAAVAHLGRELGLSPDAVSAALAERDRLPVPAGAPFLGLDAEAVVQAHLPLPPEAVQAALAAWLRHEWLERQRSEAGRTTWRARRGAAADLRRGLDVFRTLRLKGVDAVEVRTDRDADGTHVTLVLSLGGCRAEALGWLVALPTAGVAGLSLVAGLTAGPEALLGFPLAAAAGGGGWLGARAVVRSRKRQVSEAVEVVLDDLRLSR